MRFLLLILAATLLVGAEIVWTGAASSAWQRRQDKIHNPRRQLEERIAKADLVLHQLDLARSAEQAGKTLSIPRHALVTGTVLIRDETNSQNYLYVDADGYFHRDGVIVRQLRHQLQVFANESALVVVADDVVAARLDPHSWQGYLVAPRQASAPIPQSHSRVSVRDGFMRESFADDNWFSVRGNWTLRQRGGGLATDEREAESFNFQRAVNPFSLLGSDNGLATFGSGSMPNGAIAARFYFGRPKTGNVADLHTLPLASSMLLTAGDPQATLYAFGWHGPTAAFALLRSNGGAPWELVERCDSSRPPISNWFKLELQLLNATTVRGLLDGQTLTTFELDSPILGQFGIASGAEPMEVDDVTLDSLPRHDPYPGTPIFVKSKNFAAKRLKDGRDPIQFQQWAQASNTYLRTLKKVDDDRILRGITSRIPIYGDLHYQSLPEHEEAGTMPNGLWQFLITPTSNPDAGVTIEAERNDDGWAITNLPELWPTNHREFALRLFRLGEDDQRPAVAINGKRVVIGPAIPGPVKVSINRWYRSGDRLDPPAPELHDIRDTNLIQEFFEEAATDWNWTEGSFRMAARWACQAEWNFMAGASPGTPFMASKTAFHGDQEHDYHMTIRPCQPWDAGDADWVYTRAQFDRAQGWYNRHDLNFSFCAKPNEPLSGYAIVFAANENQQTLLLRQGEVIAATSDADFLIPSNGSFSSVHWKWWHFYVRKVGDRLLVDCNDKPMFDVVDPEPLDGGHIGFWTVRNGFVVSRVTSAASQLSRDADARYVPRQASPEFWRPLLRDSLSVQAGNIANSQRFTMLTGAGFQATRHVFGEPVDLQKNPFFNMNLSMSATSKVNLHLQIDGHPWLIRVNAPLEQTKRILIPRGETTTEQFRLSPMSSAEIQRHLLASVTAGKVQLNLLDLLKAARYEGPGQLEAITIGNSSNHNYLLAGGSGNHAGDWYEATPATFSAADEMTGSP